MSSPYENRYTGFTDEPVAGVRNITRQEIVTYEWRNDSLYRITTTRQFSVSGSDYFDSQEIVPVYVK